MKAPDGEADAVATLFPADIPLVRARAAPPSRTVTSMQSAITVVSPKSSGL
jgi:hypothetical protein